jgi:L-2-hydroxyglutarate oxidase
VRLVSGVSDVIVVGGGVLGCATALGLARRGRSVTLLEKERELCTHQTGHNSGVIHAGLYYKPGSLKARLSTDGRERLIAFCEAHGVPYERCGKLVVARDESEVPRLDELERRGRANGLAGLSRLGADELREHEPHVTGVAGLHVKETGIVDYRAVTNAYAKVACETGAEIVTDARVTAIREDGDAVVVESTTGTYRGRCIVACAGLGADRVARLAGMDPGVQIVPFRGEYYELAASRRGLVKHLIYPVPDPAFPFLGVHFTRRINGQVEAGPNAVLALAREGYAKTSFDLRDAFEIGTFPGVWRLAARHWKTGLGELWRSWSKSAFVRALQTLVPSLEEKDLEPAGAGVRSQAMRADGALVDDFHIVEGRRMVHVLNAPSPAATASLAIAETITERALNQLA